MAFTWAKALLRSRISPCNNLSKRSAMAIIRAPIGIASAFQSIWKSSAIIPFVMMPNKYARSPEVFDAVDRSLSSHRMFDVFSHFLRREFADVLYQNNIRGSNHADIMEL